MNNLERLKKITAIAQLLGKSALEKQSNRNLKITEKSARDFASEVDVETESMARELIAAAFPGEAIVGEENGGDARGNYWIIDPIDGTTNFLRGHPYWAVSIAWVENGEPVVGVIEMPSLAESLTGGRGCGLFLNGKLLNKRDLTGSKPALMAIGRNGIWSAQKRFELENQLEDKGFMVMTTGCCAVACAFTILGRLDGYHENHINLWDCAAGVAIGNQAGLAVTLELNQLECTLFSILRD